MKIVILEDNLMQQGYLELLVQNYLKEQKIEPASIETFSKGQKLLNSLDAIGQGVLYFLDMEIEGEDMNGIDIARKIRAFDPTALFIFVTAHSEMVSLTVLSMLNILSYISKELSKEEFINYIKLGIERAKELLDARTANNYLTFKTKKKELKLALEDLYYVESAFHQHHILIYTENETHEFPISLSEVCEKNNHLVFCNRSTVINTQKIKEYDHSKHSLTLENGEEFSVSRSRVKDITQLLQRKEEVT